MSKFVELMNGTERSPAAKQLLLLGGGHSHALALRMFGMRPIEGVRLTLVSDVSHAPYSGMLPGHIAGAYSWEEMHIDLRRLCRFAGAAFVAGTVSGIDLAGKRVQLEGRPSLHFDVLSINTGSAPARIDVPGADRHATPAKPVPGLIGAWELLCATAAERGELRVVIVGGGAGGVELALAMDARLGTMVPGLRRQISLIHGGERLLPGHNNRVRELLSRELIARHVTLVVGDRVVEVRPDLVVCSSGREVEADHVFWVTHAAAPDWVRAAGLPVDTDGFIAVGESLQVLGHDGVFAAGDVATVVSERRPKSGVFAVRAARPLVENIRRFFAGEPLPRWKPQRNFLSLIGTGRGEAVASRRFLAFQGRPAWRLKDWIDRRFMRKFEDLPPMPGIGGEHVRRWPPIVGGLLPTELNAIGQNDAAPPIVSPLPGKTRTDEVAELAARARMRCLGCAAKLGRTALERVMARVRDEFGDAIAPQHPPDAMDPERRKNGGLIVGLSEPDDAAVFAAPAGRAFVQTVDYLPALIEDPHTFGRIAALHAFSDIFAMGADAHSALVAALVPFAADSLREELLFQLISGIVVELDRMGAILIGGHSAEGAVPAVAITANGSVDPNRILRKSGLVHGQSLVLTKALGIGAIFAAEMRLDAEGRWVDAAVESMLISNQSAAGTMRGYGATALTDVTGFGLTGHLIEMLRASGTSAEIDLRRVPILSGALGCAARGRLSSIHRDNSQVMDAIVNGGDFRTDPRLALLFDPQTSGGLLGGIPTGRAEACVETLRATGYPHAAVIGTVVEQESAEFLIRLIS
jgi:selenide,water dikinase